MERRGTFAAVGILVALDLLAERAEMRKSLSNVLGGTAFAAGALAIGMTPMPLTAALAPPEGLSAIAPGLHLPSWVFATAWMIIYPSLGVATWMVWVRREQPGAKESLALFGLTVCSINLRQRSYRLVWDSGTASCTSPRPGASASAGSC